MASGSLTWYKSATVSGTPLSRHLLPTAGFQKSSSACSDSSTGSDEMRHHQSQAETACLSHSPSYPRILDQMGNRACLKFHSTFLAPQPTFPDEQTVHHCVSENDQNVGQHHQWTTLCKDVEGEFSLVFFVPTFTIGLLILIN